MKRPERNVKRQSSYTPQNWQRLTKMRKEGKCIHQAAAAPVGGFGGFSLILRYQTWFRDFGLAGQVKSANQKYCTKLGLLQLGTGCLHRNLGLPGSYVTVYALSGTNPLFIFCLPKLFDQGRPP